MNDNTTEINEVTVLKVIDNGDCTAFYECSDGNTYYESMYTCDVFEGDVINTYDYTCP